jgi:hypothetical protein
MRISIKLVLSIILALTILVVVYVFVLGPALLGLYMAKEYNKSTQRVTQFLSEGDYNLILSSCRELLRRVATGDMKGGQYSVSDSDDPEVSKFPKPILDLKPVYIIINGNDRIIVEMCGALRSCALMAFPEQHEGYDDAKLIDGLWYWDVVI